MGWKANVDVEVKARGGGIANTSWAEFANYPKYSATVGCYEGGFYKTGVWRSDAGKCCMNVNSYVFDAPSRWSLVQWVYRRAGIEESYTFEDFVVDDVIPAGLTRSDDAWYDETLPPIAPPVVFMDE